MICVTKLVFVKMRTFRFTIKNIDAWAISNKEMIVVAEDKTKAKKMLKDSGYDIKTTSELVEIKAGIHVIQEMITE